MAKLDEAKIKKILVIRPDMIGDVVLITPAIAALKNKFPSAKISVLVQAYTRQVLEGNPDVVEIIEDDIRAGKVRGLSQYLDYAAKIRLMKFDLCVNYYLDDTRYAALPFLAGIPYRIGDKAKVLNGLLYNLGAFIKWRDISRHVVELNLDLLRPLGIKESEPELKVPLLPSAQKAVSEKLKAREINEGDTKITLQLGTGGSNKSLTAEDLAKIVDGVIERTGAKVILAGGKNESALAKKVVELAKQKPVNMAGELDIPGLIALIKGSNAFIGVDTGPMHIAAAVKTPVVAIFPTKFVKPVKWGPWRTRNMIVRPETKCPLPCFPRKCRESICINDLDINEVIKATERLLKGEGNATSQASLEDWLTLSLRVLIILNGKSGQNSTRADLVEKQLSSGGIRTVRAATGAPNPASIKELYGLIAANEINVIHLIGGASFNATTAYLLSEALLLTPAQIVKDDGREFSGADDIVNFYLEKLGSEKRI